MLTKHVAAGWKWPWQEEQEQQLREKQQQEQQLQDLQKQVQQWEELEKQRVEEKQREQQQQDQDMRIKVIVRAELVPVLKALKAMDDKTEAALQAMGDKIDVARGTVVEQIDLVSDTFAYVACALIVLITNWSATISKCALQLATKRAPEWVTTMSDMMSHVALWYVFSTLARTALAGRLPGWLKTAGDNFRAMSILGGQKAKAAAPAAAPPAEAAAVPPAEAAAAPPAAAAVERRED